MLHNTIYELKMKIFQNRTLHMTNSERNAETYFSFIKSQEVTLFTACLHLSSLPFYYYHNLTGEIKFLFGRSECHLRFTTGWRSTGNDGPAVRPQCLHPSMRPLRVK